MNPPISFFRGAHPVMSCADAQAWEKKFFGDDDAKEWAAMTRAGRDLGAAVLCSAARATTVVTP
jgi:hypothetical protein